MQNLALYWGSDYDWRPCEATLNTLPQVITEIDGLDIHFIHARSQHDDALLLIVTHGWPDLIHYDQLDRGGHFAAWKQPELFSEEMRVSFRPLR